MYRWHVAAFSCGLWNICTSVDQVLDGYLIHTHVKIEALCGQRWSTEQHQGRTPSTCYLLCYQGLLGTDYLQQDSDHVCLWSGYHLHHDTAKHGYSGIVKVSTGEWNGSLLSSVMSVASVFMRVTDVHVYGVDLVSVILRSAFAHDTQAPLQASWCGGHQLQLTITSGVSAG